MPATKRTFTHDGRRYSVVLTRSGYRMRCRARGRELDFHSGTHNGAIAVEKAKAFLANRDKDTRHSRESGGFLVALVEVYNKIPRRASDKVAKNNGSALKSICREIGRNLETVGCQEIGPEFWERFQRAALTNRGLSYDLSARRREHIAINSRVRAARSLFLKRFHRHYRKAGLSVRPDAADYDRLQQPYVPPAPIDDGRLLQKWQELRPNGQFRDNESKRLWLTIGLARFAGLRRNEICALCVGWMDGPFIAMRDRPEEGWQHKTGRPYYPEVINDELLDWIEGFCATHPANTYIVPSPEDGGRERKLWFQHVPRRWLKANGFVARQPLHRLRGLYADQHARERKEERLAKREAIKRAQENLGHGSAKTTLDSYLDQTAAVLR